MNAAIRRSRRGQNRFKQFEYWIEFVAILVSGGVSRKTNVSERREHILLTV